MIKRIGYGYLGGREEREAVTGVGKWFICELGLLSLKEVRSK